MRSRDGNSTPKWRRNEKSGWKQRTGKLKQVDQTSFLPLPRSFFCRLGRPTKLPLPVANPTTAKLLKSELLNSFKCHSSRHPIENGTWTADASAKNGFDSRGVFRSDDEFWARNWDLKRGSENGAWNEVPRWDLERGSQMGPETRSRCS